jgi:hypothetical protein
MDASKFLIRPAIEIAFRLEAVRKHPDLLYRIAFSEHLREKQLLQAAAEHGQANPTLTPELDEKWNRFSRAFAATDYPYLPICEVRLAERQAIFRNKRGTSLAFGKFGSMRFDARICAIRLNKQFW